MAYIITKVTLLNAQGEEHDYEVGADVGVTPGGFGYGRGYEVGEPDISPPDGTLDEGRLEPNPQQPGVLQEGWSDIVEQALAEEAEREGLSADDFGPEYEREDD